MLKLVSWPVIPLSAGTGGPEAIARFSHRPSPPRFARSSHYLPDWHPWEDYRSGYKRPVKSRRRIIPDDIHDIDLVRWLCGSYQQSLLAVPGSRPEIEPKTSPA